MGQDKGCPHDVADLARAGGDVLEGSPPAGEQGEPAFAQAAQRSLEGVAGTGIDIEFAPACGLLHRDMDPGARALFEPVDSVVFSPDGKTLATGAWAGGARLWNVATHQQTASLSDGAEAIYSVAFSPDGKTLATGSGTGNGNTTGTGGAVQLWDLTTGQQIGGPLSRDTGTVASVAFSPDGKTLATGSWDGTARLWDVGMDPYTLIDHPPGQQRGTEPIYSVAFSRACNTLATGASTDTHVTVQLWDTIAHRQISPPLSSSNIGPLSPVAVGPSCKTVAVGGGSFTGPGGAVQLWDGTTHRQIGILMSGTGAIDSLAFSPDGKTLAIGTGSSGSHEGDTGTVQLWDVATRQQIGSPRTDDTGPVDSVAFSPDGKTLAASTEGTIPYAGTVQLWNVAYLVNPVPYLCASAGQTLTRAQWTLYVGDLPYQNLCP
jgi:WD40 repeat protein